MARIARTTVPLLAILLATPALAQVYKWVDEDGVTHYSQQPPPGGEAQVINPDISLPDEPPPGASGNGGEGGSSASEGGGGESRSIAEFCKELRDQAQLLASDRPVRVKQDEDTVTTLEGDARQQRLSEVQSQIQEHCQDQGS